MSSSTDKFRYIAWMDLETTGTNPAMDEILEVALVVTDRKLHTVTARNWTIYPMSSGRLLTMEDVVIDMHTKSGLIADVLKSRTRVGAGIEQCDITTAKVLKKYLTDGEIVLAGSGVSHFDHEFIKRRMPMTAKLLHYATIDVGVLRRSLRLAGWKIPTEPKIPLTHRAMTDIQDHIEEMRGYMTALKAKE